MAQWEFMARTALGETMTSIALEALDGALGRLQALESQRENIRPAWTALAEGVWWVAALDEQMVKRLGDWASSYRAARDVSPDGRYVSGFLWVRDRHTHQLPLTMARDDAPFFAELGEAAVLHISKGFTWRPSADISEPGESRSRPAWRGAYDGLLAGESTWKTLKRCSRWFHRLAQHEGYTD